MLTTACSVSNSILSVFNFANQETEVKKYMDIKFDDYAKYKFNANKLDIISKFTPSFSYPNVEHLMPISTEKTAINWANDRLIANSPDSPYKLQFIIYDASVTEKDLIEDSIIDTDMIKYTARLDISIRVVDKDENILAETTSSSWREVTSKKNSKIYSKEEIWYQMVQKLALDFNEKIESGINNYLNQYLLIPNS